MNIIQTDNLTKKFGSATAVQGLSITVCEGEIFGFLGLNGAGKTTTIRMLLGMIRPTSGTIQLFGENLATKPNVWNEVGYMVETPHSYPELTVKENLSIIARLRGLQGAKAIDEVIERLNLVRYRDTEAQHLSLGNAQRLGLAKALIHKPKLLVLDEPINGLDPAGILEIRKMLQELASNGTTIFLSSHILSEMAKLATRIGIIHNGKLLKQLLTTELEQELKKTLLLGTGNNADALKLLQERGFQAIVDDGALLHLTNKHALQYPETIAEMCMESHLSVKHLSVVEEDLEQYFLRTIHA